jgi:7,8-dihydropterin-6-yl-methyl-4-(beta-D-ribofuranosyl)aminobenzene 5'-phosphate synthase
MEIKVIFDKEAISKNLHTGWGLSILIDKKILFDTGEKGNWLIENMKSMNINMDEIEGIVISHDHWDHTGGLKTILKEKKNKTPVYICKDFSDDLKEMIKDCGGEVVEVKEWDEISKNIYTTGEIKGTYKGSFMPEQAVILKTENGITILTGCAHPGIIEIINIVKNKFKEEKIFLVIGGFHLLEKEKRFIDFIVKEFKKMNVEKVGPCHCSGPEAEKIFENEYKDKFVSVKAGISIIV